MNRPLQQETSLQLDKPYILYMSDLHWEFTNILYLKCKKLYLNA